MKKLEGKTALVTGGSKGIGIATAKLFVQEGAKAIITGRTLTDLQKASAEIGNNITSIQSDTGNLHQISTLFEKLHENNTKLDIVFINAGIAEGAFVGDVTEALFDNHININYKGAFFTVKAALPYLNKGASIIFVASVAGHMGIKNLSVYSATKAALISLTKTLAADLAPQGIRVNSISPGYIWTPLGEKNNTQHYDAICKSIPFENRFGRAEEIAQAGLFLASSMSSYITGQNIIVDGGLSAITPSIA